MRWTTALPTPLLVVLALAATPILLMLLVRLAGDPRAQQPHNKRLLYGVAACCGLIAIPSLWYAGQAIYVVVQGESWVYLLLVPWSLLVGMAGLSLALFFFSRYASAGSW